MPSPPPSTHQPTQPSTAPSFARIPEPTLALPATQQALPAIVEIGSQARHAHAPAQLGRQADGSSSVTPLARKSKAGCNLAPSPFRPHVPAAERLTSWTSQWSVERQTEAAKDFGIDVAQSPFRIATAALDKDTRESYAAGLLRYAQFCDARGVSEALRIPAPPILITAFVSHSLGLVSGSCVRGWLAGLRAWHGIMGAPWCGDDMLVGMSRTAAKKEGRIHTRQPRPPATLAHLSCLYAALTLSDPLDAAIWAAVTSAFWGCRRLGELLPTSQPELDPMYHPMCTTLLQDMKNLGDGYKAMFYRVPWTKTTREEGASVILVAQDSELCAIKAMCTHMMVNVGAAPNEHLFAYKSPDGTFLPLTKTRLLTRCNEIWSKARLRTLSGHCFRIGGTTHWLLQGAPTEIVAAIGGWTSLAFLLYWRKVEDIIAAGLVDAMSKSDAARLGKKVDEFRVSRGIPKDLGVETRRRLNVDE
ncbi:DNA breaking-rejoining enzyme [Punctularia strigosozonata HHB-11173 SS5]|uniref:DNA breaking-rejoining enzyme n=1 Tax=Punctularia strigosozonata (strain HHB-11173) TaxID=741275 RepID=UPI000441728C|nr:DNA breaking-rejoining enzyme [Punctularia strigosozonata HHB-11173 SS5]EIN14054.1 DNA breaking-rejoining enzyme [Punctularia strigosozonata HHB-11173 SS5]